MDSGLEESVPVSPFEPRDIRGSKSGNNACVDCLLGMRTRTVIILIILFVIMFLTFLAILAGVIPTQFTNLEKITVSDALRRTTRGIYDALNNQITIQIGFAGFDESVEVVTMGTPDSAICATFLENNFPDPLMAESKLNLVALYNLAGEITCSKTYDIETQTANSFAIPEEIIYLNPETHPLIVGTNDTTIATGGFLNVNGTLLAITGLPVQDSTFEGPAHGLLLWAFFQSADYTQELAEREQLCVTFNPINSNVVGPKSGDDLFVEKEKSLITSYPPIGFTMDTPDWNNTDPIRIETLPDSIYLSSRRCWDPQAVNASSMNRQSALGYIPDIFGNPVTFVRADIDRNVYLSLQGQTLGLSLGLVAGISIIAIFVMIIFVERAVLHPMIALSRDVKKISDSGDVKERLTLQSKSELGRLANNINIMMSALDDSQQKLAEEHQKLQDLVERTSIEEQFSRSMMNAIADFLLLVRTDGIVHQTNSSFLEKFQFTATDVNGKLQISKVIEGVTMETIIELCESNSQREFSMFAKFQEKIPVLVSVNAIDMFIDEQRVKAYVVVARNMSEKKTLMDSLERDKKKMADLERDLEFNAVWRDPSRKRSLERYCVRMKCDENVRFVDSILEYKATRKQHHRLERQKRIIENFLKEGSPYELNLPSTDLKPIFEGYGQIDLFDGLLEIVKGMVVLETLPRWTEWELENPPTEDDTASDTLSHRSSMDRTSLDLRSDKENPMRKGSMRKSMKTFKQ